MRNGPLPAMTGAPGGLVRPVSPADSGYGGRTPSPVVDQAAQEALAPRRVEPKKCLKGRVSAFMGKYNSHLLVASITLVVVIQILGMLNGRDSKAASYVAVGGSVIFLPFTASTVTKTLDGRIKNKTLDGRIKKEGGLSREDKMINMLITVGVLASVIGVLARSGRGVAGLLGQDQTKLATLIFNKVMPAIAIGSGAITFVLAAHKSRSRSRVIEDLTLEINERKGLRIRRKRSRALMLQAALAVAASALGFSGFEALDGGLSVAAGGVAFGRFLHRRSHEKAQEKQEPTCRVVTVLSTKRPKDSANAADVEKLFDQGVF